VEPLFQYENWQNNDRRIRNMKVIWKFLSYKEGTVSFCLTLRK
jgi:hypothetical protein